MIGIYKITNLKNGKVYIGQSRQIEKRFQQHRNKSKFLEEDKWYSPLYIDMYSFGIDNFSFEVIEECTIEELNEKEEYWIKYYNSQEDGYNITSGGDCTGKLSSDDVKNIIKLLQEKRIDNYEIAKFFNISDRTVREINSGKEFYNKDIKYPIRTYKDNLSIYYNKIGKNQKERKKENYCIDCGKEIGHRAIRCEKCDHIKQRKVKERPSKEKLFNLIKIKSFEEIGRIYDVSGNTIRSWCKSYNLPYRRRDL